jgi:D-alanyl-D-alanine carboxypeptidase
MENELIRDVVSRKSAKAAGRTLRNHNKLLWLYEGAVGVKTGYTRAAGRTLVSCARREGLTLLCVTLNAPEDWKDHAALLDWGFAHYAHTEPGEQSWTVDVVSGLSGTVEAIPGEGELPLLPKEGWHWEVRLPGFVYAPVAAGETAGRLLCRSENGEVLAELPLVFARDVPLDPEIPLGFWEKLRWAWFFACRHAPNVPQTAFY